MAGSALCVAGRGGNGTLLSTSSSQVFHINPANGGCNQNVVGSVPESNMQLTIRKACTVRNLSVRCSANSFTGASTVVSRVNGANGNLSVSIGAGLTGLFEDTTHSDTLSAGDLYNWQYTTGTAGGGLIRIRHSSAEFVSSSGNAHNYHGNGNTPYSSSGTSTNFFPFAGENVALTDSDDTSRPEVACAGVFSNLQVYVSANGRGTATTINSRVNGANGNQTISIGAGSTGLFEDTTHSDTVAAGDRCGISLVPGTGAGTLTVRRFSQMFVGTDDATPYVGCATHNSLGGTFYGPLGSINNLSATESDVQVRVPFNAHYKRFAVRGLWGASSSMAARKNGADTALAMSQATTGSQTFRNTTDTVDITANDTIDFKVVCTSFNFNYFSVAIFNGFDVPPPAPLRMTQGGGYAGIQLISEDVRLTQGGGYTGIHVISEHVRLTQGGGYTGRQYSPPLRMTQGGGYVGIRILRPGCLTNEAMCWRIERQDGQVFAFTAHDQTITFKGDIYEPCGSLLASALQTSAEFGSTENMDLSGVIAAGAFTVSDLWAGLWDGADVQVWRVDWKDPTQAELMAAGRTASLEFGDTGFKFEVTTAGQRLQQRPILQPVTPTCRFKLGDARCTIDLEALRVSGTVTSVASPDYRIGAEQRVFTDTGRTETDNYFQLGSLRWETGRNTGQQMDVKRFTSDTFQLERPTQYPIEVGDTYSVVPGCDRIFETCDTKFANSINFGGYPHLRGTDDLQKTPGFKQ